MTITRSTHVIAVPDLQRSAEFYRDVLGFEIREIGDPGWRMYVCGACRIMAGACADALPPQQLGDHSYFAYLTVDDADALYGRISAAGAQILKAPVSEPWGLREFGVRTVDGHRIMFGQELA